MRATVFRPAPVPGDPALAWLPADVPTAVALCAQQLAAASPAPVARLVDAHRARVASTHTVAHRAAAWAFAGASIAAVAGLYAAAWIVSTPRRLSAGALFGAVVALVWVVTS